MAAIRLENLHKTYPGGHVAVCGLEMGVCDGEIVTLVGPSGCGKSTVLRLVAGLETPTQGRVWLDEQDVTALSPQQRDLAMVFQSYALYPHKSVRENLAFGLRMHGIDRNVTAARVEKVAKTLGLDTVLDRKPGQLSGGQRQRVALGRAIAREPRAFLLDEPLSNLDARLRLETRAELTRLHRQLGATMLYVTHDQEEAMTLGGRVAVLREGRLQQIAPPLEVYRKPANAFVGGFIGSPAMNFLAGVLRSEGGKVVFKCPELAVELGEDRQLHAESKNVVMGIRPHDVELVLGQGMEATARVDIIEPLGNALVVHVELITENNGGKLTVVTPSELEIAVGNHVGLRFRPERLHLFDAESGKRVT
jgi:multiple sugar transport system ATP-binding protein